MKIISKLSNVSLFLVLLISLFGCAVLSDFRRTQPVEVSGYWEMEFSGNWRAIFYIETNESGNLTAWTKTTKDGLLYQATPAGKVKVRGGSLELVTNPGQGVIYKGKYHVQEQKFKGALHYPNGSTHDVELCRIDTTGIAGFFPKDDRSTDYTYSQPLQLEDGISTDSITESSLDQEAFKAFSGAALSREIGEIHSILIYENGNLVAEEYFYDYDRNRLHWTHSVTKSVLSLLIGIALEQQPSFSIDLKVADLLPTLGGPPPAGEIPITDLMSMTAGLDELHFRLDGKGEWIDKILDLVPNDSLRGTFKYEDMYSELLGVLLSENLDEQISTFASRELFTPMGIDDYKWDTRSDGYNNVSSGLVLTPRDMLKIGILVLNNGNWEGNQLVPENWIDSSTNPKVKVQEPYYYGYHWWLIDGSTLGLEGFIPVAQGAGGQRIYVIPQKQAVVVLTGGNFDNNPPIEKYLMQVLNI